MTALTRHDQALFETTRRVLAEVVNEGLVRAKVEVTAPEGPGTLCLLSPQDVSWVKVGVTPGTVIEMKEDRVVSVIRPESLQPPVIVGETGNQELDPGAIFAVLSALLKDVADGTVLEAIVRELRNSATNQDIPGMLTPTLAFVSVPCDNLRITGHFERELQPLLKRLDIPQTTSDRVIVPCLAQQLPSILQRFPDVVILKLAADCADAQASMRTITIRPELGFKYHLKLSLACHITGALRTITPWTACGGPVQTELLEKFLPDDLWVFREVAAVSGSQKDFNEARHLACILRDTLESRAQANDEVLIMAMALTQKPYGDSRTYAEILYNLETVVQKKEWFQSLVLPPLVQYGIGLEGHGQNLVVRVCRQTGQIKGFAVRDFGGVRMHVPTLNNHGVKFDSLPPGGATLTDNLDNVWSKVHHSLLQNHVGFLLVALGLENHGGWAITLETLSTVLGGGQDSPGAKLLEYFTKDTMPFKCFLRMRMESKYRDVSFLKDIGFLGLSEPRTDLSLHYNLTCPTITKMSQPKLAILDDYQNISPAHFAHLEDRISISYFPETLNPRDERQRALLIERLQPFDVILAMRERTPFPKETLSALPNLKLLLTTGTRNLALDVQYCASRGIPVAGTGGRPAGVHSTVQHTWALILGLARHVARDDAAVKRGEWQGSLGMTLAGKTLGLLGLGKLGSQVGRIAVVAFDMKVIAWSTNLTQEKADEQAAALGLPAGSFQAVRDKAEFFRSADVVSLHSVLSERSRGIVGAAELEVMKPTAILVNTSRGPLVEEKALLETLNAGRIRGAALDVFEPEPLPKDSPWRTTAWGQDGRSEVVLSPHMGYGDEQIHGWYDEVASNLERWLNGEELNTRMN
ncbi:unnamed protein product [Aspergillus oryzae var. brunneus]|nr:unnamed protein product [Aspergillus oryzae]GMG41904.1 unnamed protein product [Aspergillus oryzae var. brunneus]